MLQALSIFDSLQLLRLAPDTTITNAAIAACDKGGQWQRAHQIFTYMEGQGLPRDTITFSSTISALSKSKNARYSIDVRPVVLVCTAARIVSRGAPAAACVSHLTSESVSQMWSVRRLDTSLGHSLSHCCRCSSACVRRASPSMASRAAA
jgi:hypothetical protein